jgi:hypothetical protein
VIKDEQPNVTYFSAAELFTGGGEGFVGGEPGESWQGWYRVDSSDSGHVIVEDPRWTVHVAGKVVALIPADDVAMALVEALSIDPPPSP